MSIRTMPQTGGEVRALIQSGEWKGPTSGLAPGYVQANLAILPKELAFDFLLFCQRNSRPCPALEVLEPGHFEPKKMAPGADLRTDVPRYRIFKDGEIVEDVEDIRPYWRDDLVSFLTGCSFTFETAMVNAGIPLRHVEDEKNISMYVTNIETTPAGRFSGPMVVSMRPIHHSKVVRAVQVTSRFPWTHGAPVHVGDAEAIGIRDINKPEYGDPTRILEGEVPVFWACGVTSQVVALNSKPPFMITHSPGHMFISDWRDEDLVVF